jgi:DNA-directed RNA polymerase specialized sigma subunit
MAKGLIRIDNRSAIDKTINLLYKYEQLKLSDQPSTLKRVAQVDVALEQIRDDPFYAIIPLYYFEKETRENIAEYFNVSEKTVTRNRKRLIRQMAVILFSDDVIMDILS